MLGILHQELKVQSRLQIQVRDERVALSVFPDIREE